MTTESALMAVLSTVVTVFVGVVLVVGRFALQRMDRGLGELAELKGAVLGVEGRGGLASDVQDHEARLRTLEQGDP